MLNDMQIATIQNRGAAIYPNLMVIWGEAVYSRKLSELSISVNFVAIRMLNRGSAFALGYGATGCVNITDVQFNVAVRATLIRNRNRNRISGTTQRSSLHLAVSKGLLNPSRSVSSAAPVAP